MKPPGAETRRNRVLSDDEIRLFWRACAALDWPFGPMFQLLLLTGQRREEVAAISWTEIDGDLWRIPGARTKNGKAHDVPLTPQALRLLRSLPTIARLVENALRRHLGVRMTCHQFRHLAAKIMLDADPGAYDMLRQLLGHKNLKTTLNYYAELDTRRVARIHSATIERRIARASGKRVPARR